MVLHFSKSSTTITATTTVSGPESGDPFYYKYYGEGDDESSTSSTVRVDWGCSCSSHEELSKSNSSKTVRFNMDMNEEYENRQLCKEDWCENSWYDSEDYRAFRLATKTSAKSAAASDANYSVSSVGPAGPSSSYETTMVDAYRYSCRTGCHASPFFFKQNLRKWVGESTPSRTGLHKWILPELRREMNSRRSAIIDMVISTQDDDMDSCSSSPAVAVPSSYTQDISGWIGENCEMMSRPALTFAQLQAEALASALANGQTAA
jgi:hypothetical protein